MRGSTGALALVVVAAVVGAVAGGSNAEPLTAQACREGVDTVKSTAFLDVYCGPASARIKSAIFDTAKGPVTNIFKPGTCLRGLRGPGSFDLYVGKDKSGPGPWPPLVHISKPTASAKPGIYMEWRYTQVASLSSIKLTLTPTGGSFSGTALVRSGGKVTDRKAPVEGTFTCGS